MRQDKSIPPLRPGKRPPRRRFRPLRLQSALRATLHQCAHHARFGGDSPARANRDASHPVVIAGGSGCYNPEPMSAFFDAMVIGEGEEVVFDVIQRWEGVETRTEEQRTKNRGVDVETPILDFDFLCAPLHLWTMARRHPRRLRPCALRAGLRRGWDIAGNTAHPSRRSGGGDETGGDCATPARHPLYRAQHRRRA